MYKLHCNDPFLAKNKSIAYVCTCVDGAGPVLKAA